VVNSTAQEPRMDTLSRGERRLIVNGSSIALPQEASELPLLWFLRDRLGLKGAKFGCGHGGCGACLVEADGEAMTACNHPAAAFLGKSVKTIEAIAAEEDNPVIRAWLAEQVPQCGYCQPGMIVAANALLARDPKPSDHAIDQALSHVLCRCGTYPRARRAVHRAAEGRWAGAPFPEARMTPAPQAPASAVVFNPWVKIARDGTVVVVIGQAEMGQGITTSLPMLVAEELGVPLERVATETAPADHIYDNPFIHEQMTVGSLSIRTNWERMRRAGAEVRERLIAAAAARWNVAAKECRAQEGEVVHTLSGRALNFGALAEAAAALSAPKNPPLKSIDEFELLGKPTARREIPAHIAGRTVFGMDVDLPGALCATMLMPPVIGAKLERVDTAVARAIPGVHDVVHIPSGIAVVADDFWSAMKGREALGALWSGGLAGVSSGQITQRLRQALGREGEHIQEHGDALGALDRARTVIEAEYETPYLAHAPIEPMNCAARLTDGLCDIWVPTQSQTIAQDAAARAAGLPPEKIRVHTTYLGGGFGRRTVPDFVTQAVEIAKATGQPIRLAWTRDEDMRNDHYRPASLTLLRGGLDARGEPIAWFLRAAGPELVGEGLDVAYDLPDLRTEHVLEDPGVPTGYWRCVGATQHAFAVEGFMDELAHAACADPVEFRLRHLGSSPRLKAALALAAAKSHWNEPPLPGRARGAAAYRAHGGWCAQIAEVARETAGGFNVARITCAVDCGFVVNPDTVKAQLEGAIIFGLTAALKGEITIADGRVQQTGFRDYPLLTIAETPEIEVHIVPSREAPSGAGECGVPPVAPAVVNAIFAATGHRIRRLPILKG
jgi:isoquinoline 1-oxidoreductase beta subunit